MEADSGGGGGGGGVGGWGGGGGVSIRGQVGIEPTTS